MRAFAFSFAALASVTAVAGVVITETLPPYGICYTTGSKTVTSYTPGATAHTTLPGTTTSTSVIFVYPTARAGAGIEERAPEETTIVEVVPCSSTNTVTPTITSPDSHWTTTVTDWKSTQTITETYTLCAPGNICG